MTAICETFIINHLHMNHRLTSYGLVRHPWGSVPISCLNQCQIIVASIYLSFLCTLRSHLCVCAFFSWLQLSWGCLYSFFLHMSVLHKCNYIHQGYCANAFVRYYIRKNHLIIDIVNCWEEYNKTLE